MIGYAVGVLITLIVLGVALGYSFGSATFLYFVLQDDNVGQVVSVAFRTIDSFTYLAIPFFLLAGSIMQNGGLSRRLIDFVGTFTGWLKGGMAATLVGAGTLFGAISGSSVASVSAIGRIMSDGMAARGYSRKFVGGLTATSGIIGILIPPSVPMIVYGTSAGVSIGDMFLAGITSGLLMAVLLILNALLWARRQPGIDDKAGILLTRNTSNDNKNKRFDLFKGGIKRFGI